MTTTSQGWAVSFGGVSIPFATHAEAKKYIKQAKKLSEKRRGVLNAVIVRSSVVESRREVVQ